MYSPIMAEVARERQQELLREAELNRLLRQAQPEQDNVGRRALLALGSRLIPARRDSRAGERSATPC